MFKNRNRIIIAVFIVWAFFITFRLFYYTSYSREYYLEEGNRNAWRSGTIPAARGRILDKNGLPLAWTRRYHDLVIEAYPDLCRPNAMLVNELNGKIQGLSPDEKKEKYVKKGLSPSEISLLRDYMSKYSGVKIIPRLERRYVDYPEVRKFLGKVVINNGKCYGLDGAERDYDSELNGIDGVYVVMLDRYRKWIPGTWKLKTEMLPGKDVMLENSIEDIISMQKNSNEGKEL
jgi:cell division protein FtsI (penicillin-binding protein 3)